MGLKPRSACPLRLSRYGLLRIRPPRLWRRVKLHSARQKNVQQTTRPYIRTPGTIMVTNWNLTLQVSSTMVHVQMPTGRGRSRAPPIKVSDCTLAHPATWHFANLCPLVLWDLPSLITTTRTTSEFINPLIITQARSVHSVLRQLPPPGSSFVPKRNKECFNHSITTQSHYPVPDPPQAGHGQSCS